MPDHSAAQPGLAEPGVAERGRAKRGLILVTRPEPGASETASRLQGDGWTCVTAPFLTIQTRPVTLPRAPLQAVLVTSGNALGALSASLHATPLLAVGGRTADRARAAGFSMVHSAEGDAAAMAALAPTLFDRAAGPLLLASGRGQGATLAAALRQAGFRVHRRVAYEAARVRVFPPNAAAALLDNTHATLFFSADTARAFVRLLPVALTPALTRTAALTIGAETAAALQGLPFRCVRVSVRPTLDGVLALL